MAIGAFRGNPEYVDDAHAAVMTFRSYIAGFLRGPTTGTGQGPLIRPHPPAAAAGELSEDENHRDNYHDDLCRT